MGLRNRINILLKSQFNYWVTLAEDPEKIINQALEEMDEGLDRAKTKLMALKFRVEEEERLLHRIRQQISFWQERVKQLIEGDMEENAKDAVRKRRILEDEERRLKIKQSNDEKRLKEMELTLNELENRVQLAKSKKNILIKDIRLRKGISKETNKLGECRGIDFEEPFTLFRKMEEKIEEETELSFLSHEREKEARDKEESLIKEEIEFIKRKIKEGGDKK